MVIGKKLVLSVFVIVVALVVSAKALEGQAPPPRDWAIPDGAAAERNPLAPTPDVLKSGLQIFETKCQACHGKDGTGRASATDPQQRAGNLTDRIRASFNPDGVMFYKVWNGRDKPRMPAFKTDGLSKEEVWTVVTYVKTLRK